MINIDVRIVIFFQCEVVKLSLLKLLSQHKRLSYIATAEADNMCSDKEISLQYTSHFNLTL